MRVRYYYCCVPQCKSWETRKDKLSFHKFPEKGQYKVSIQNNNGNFELDDARNAWIVKMGIVKPITKFTRICSLHFKKDDYIPRSTSCNVKRRILKKTAVPSFVVSATTINVPNLQTPRCTKDDVNLQSAGLGQPTSSTSKTVSRALSANKAISPVIKSECENNLNYAAEDEDPIDTEGTNNLIPPVNFHKKSNMDDKIVCELCSDNFGLNPTKVRCFNCEKFFHPKCVPLNDEQQKDVNKSDRASFWICDVCKVGWIQKMDVSQSMLMENVRLKQENALLKSLNSELKCDNLLLKEKLEMLSAHCNNIKKNTSK